MYELIDAGLNHPMTCVGPVLATGVYGAIRHWLTHRAILRHESETTQRLKIAVADTSTAERADVLRAYAAIEAAMVGESSGRDAPHECGELGE
jgi:hypothetical protein